MEHLLKHILPNLRLFCDVFFSLIIDPRSQSKKILEGEEELWDAVSFYCVATLVSIVLLVLIAPELAKSYHALAALFFTEVFGCFSTAFSLFLGWKLLGHANVGFVTFAVPIVYVAAAMSVGMGIVFAAFFGMGEFFGLYASGLFKLMLSTCLTTTDILVTSFDEGYYLGSIGQELSLWDALFLTLPVVFGMILFMYLGIGLFRALTLAFGPERLSKKVLLALACLVLFSVAELIDEFFSFAVRASLPGCT